MSDRRLIDLSAYAFALGALALLALAFFAARNGAALVMCGLIITGLVVARLANFSARTLVPVALGLTAILWMVWIDPPASSHKTSALAHAAEAARWRAGRVSEYLRTRLVWPFWAVAALAAVFGVTLLWEIGELLGDRVLDTALVPNARDSAYGRLLRDGGRQVRDLRRVAARPSAPPTGSGRPLGRGAVARFSRIVRGRHGSGDPG